MTDVTAAAPDDATTFPPVRVQRQTPSGVVALVLGLLTLTMALFARGGIWGLICKVVDAPWFPTRRTLLEDRR